MRLISVNAGVSVTWPFSALSSVLIQAQRQVTLGALASLFPQPIKYASRKRNLQRFLVLPRLSLKLLWFPLVKYWIRQAQTGHRLNREQHRRLKKLIKVWVLADSHRPNPKDFHFEPSTESHHWGSESATVITQDSLFGYLTTKH